jgi:adenylate cyclase
MIDRLPRKLAAILYADVAGYSRLTGNDEDATHLALREYLDVIANKIDSHGGQVMHYAGDAVLARFDAVVDAMSAAVSIQDDLATENEKRSKENCVQFRIGINLGDVIEDRGDIYGEGVNIAARLEELAEPGGVCISASVRVALGNKIDVDFEDLGEQSLKNIDKPIQAYRVYKRVRTSFDTQESSPEPTSFKCRHRPSVAILPFKNLSGDPGQQYLADGVTENIITGLTRFRSLLVTAFKSSLVASRENEDVRRVAEELGVATVVEGTVSRLGDQVRVTAQLIDASDGYRIWAESYVKDMEDVFVAQDEISKVIVATIAGRIEEQELEQASNKVPDNMVAYECVLRGRQHLNKYNQEEITKARMYFEKAISLDSALAEAYGGLALSYVEEYDVGQSDAALYQGYTFAKKAVSLDINDCRARYALARVYVARKQYELAKTQIEKALNLNPNDYLLLCTKGWFLSFCGEAVNSMACSLDAIRLNPFAPNDCLFAMAVAHYIDKRYEDAVSALGEVIPLDAPRGALLAASFAQLGFEDQAQATATETLESIDADITEQNAGDSQRWRTYWSKLFPFKNDDDFEHLLDGCRKAGLMA